MKLHLRIIKSPDNTAPLESEKSFDELGGSIGRGDDNHWVLADPDRFLSSRHCLISQENNQFYITDESTNGTFLNHSPQPVGKGNKVVLGDGDEIELGDFCLSVSIREDASSMKVADPFPDAGSSHDSSDSPWGEPFPTVADDVLNSFGESESLSPEKDIDSLSALDRKDQTFAPDPFPDDFFAIDSFPDDRDDQFSPSGSQADCANPINQAVDWPEIIARPDVAPSTKKPITKKKITRSTAEPLLAKSVSANTKNTVDKSLIAAMGLDEGALSDVQILAISGTVGRLMREMLKGMMDIMQSRSEIKNQFRMNMTTIQSVENNPLKFSPNIDDLLEKMFMLRNKAYKKPVDAVREGFQEIADHQLALIAGLRAAFDSMMKRFDPVALEKQFDRQKKGSITLSMGKSKYWHSYAEYYKSLIDNRESSFQHLFGDQFVQAYEEQLRKLEFARERKQELQ